MHEYRILHADSRLVMNDLVSAHLNDGWKLAGGVSVVRERARAFTQGEPDIFITMYYQAVRRKKEVSEIYGVNEE